MGGLVLGAVGLLLVVTLASQVEMVLLRWLVAVTSVLDTAMVLMDSLAKISLFRVMPVIVVFSLVLVGVGIVVSVGVVR